MRFFASGGIFRFGALLTVKTGLYLESFSKGQLLCRTRCARQGCTALRSGRVFCTTAFFGILQDTIIGHGQGGRMFVLRERQAAQKRGRGYSARTSLLALPRSGEPSAAVISACSETA